MKRIVEGVVRYKENVLPTLKSTFAKLAEGQQPIALVISCCDSRVDPSLFTSSGPGDLFVLRTIGNIVPSCDSGKCREHDSAGSALEFAALHLGIKDIIVCGHSNCGAMKAVSSSPDLSEHLESWLSYGKDSLRKLKEEGPLDDKLPLIDQLSQTNTLQQLQHLRTYGSLKPFFAKGQLNLHAWWFDVTSGDVLSYNSSENRFVAITSRSLQSC